MKSPYRLYLRSFGRIIGRHDLWTDDHEESFMVASVLTTVYSDYCDEFEIWRDRQAVRLGCRPDKALLDDHVPARILAAAKKAAEELSLDGWSAFEGWGHPSARKEWKYLHSPEKDLTEIVSEALSVTGADMGNIQILDRESGGLRIVAHQGFGADFLDFFAHVRHGEAACGSALTSLKRVIVTDVATNPIFNGKRAREVMLESGARSVQSTPLVSDGRLVGMLSTHRQRKWRVNSHELRHLDRIADHAAREIDGRRNSLEL